MEKYKDIIKILEGYNCPQYFIRKIIEVIDYEPDLKKEIKKYANGVDSVEVHYEHNNERPIIKSKGRKLFIILNE